jgi:hypothetical protein
LPVDVMAPRFLQELPGNASRFFISLITSLLLDVEGYFVRSQTLSHLPLGFCLVESNVTAGHSKNAPTV